MAKMAEKVMILGKSESGKTSLCAVLAKAMGKPVVVVNNKAENCPWENTVDWKNVLAVRDKTIVIEDLLGCTDGQYKLIQKLLGYSGHHDRTNTIIIVHTLLKNQCVGLLGFLTSLYITLAKTNSDSIAIAFRKYNFPPLDRLRHLKTFEAAEAKFGFFKIDPEKKSFLRDGDEETAAAGSDKRTPCIEDYRRTAEVLLAELDGGGRKAMTIFNLIIKKLDLSCISPADLSITLYRENSGIMLRCSLVDYVNALLVTDTPARDLKCLHSYITSRIVLPQCYIRNKELRQA